MFQRQSDKSLSKTKSILILLDREIKQKTEIIRKLIEYEHFKRYNDDKRGKMLIQLEKDIKQNN